ncbi:hypothetical protein Glove_323g12 [Diversispora epigaea]|uniref:Uncharacterized protein n=1 Tax=Diversispora epigaea TaxID=1348612 RepID=A0A397HN26_9GLOM|nr:hypothetical protein Glove_323g12 [Diversispora epigaea]
MKSKFYCILTKNNTENVKTVNKITLENDGATHATNYEEVIEWIPFDRFDDILLKEVFAKFSRQHGLMQSKRLLKKS